MRLLLLSDTVVRLNQIQNYSLDVVQMQIMQLQQENIVHTDTAKLRNLSTLE